LCQEPTLFKQPVRLPSVGAFADVARPDHLLGKIIAGSEPDVIRPGQDEGLVGEVAIALQPSYLS
jgi:hypothetical protein